MTTLALWLLISGGNGKPIAFVPFANQGACEYAMRVLADDDSRASYHCVPSGATVGEEAEAGVKQYRE